MRSIPTVSLLLALVAYIPLVHSAGTQKTSSCTCSTGFINVDVDVNVAIDPSNGRLLNETALRRQHTTFQLFGQLCEPAKSSQSSQTSVQLLVHGLSYTHQYWDPEWNGFQNYSYVDFSCAQGVASFAYDNICAGMSAHPNTSEDCQISTAAVVASGVARKLKDGSIAAALTGVTHRYSKVFGIGHSLGTVTLNYAAILDGKNSPFAGMIFTSGVHAPNVTEFLGALSGIFVSAASVDPVRWGQLDPGYVSTPSEDVRRAFYGKTGSFNPTILDLDFLTQDVGPIWILKQIGNLNFISEFQGPITTIVGEFDQSLCMPCIQQDLEAAEKPFFPKAEYKLVVARNSGHDIDFHFAAANIFPLMLDLFRAATS